MQKFSNKIIQDWSLKVNFTLHILLNEKLIQSDGLSRFAKTWLFRMFLPLKIAKSIYNFLQK